MFRKIASLIYNFWKLTSPSGIVFTTYSRNGEKYLKIFDRKKCEIICFKVDSIDYENSCFRGNIKEENMFNDIGE